jgi:hypothetical protein
MPERRAARQRARTLWRLAVASVMLSRMGYEYRIAVSAKRSDIEAVLGRIQACQRNGDEFVYQGDDPAGRSQSCLVPISSVK